MNFARRQQRFQLITRDPFFTDENMPTATRLLPLYALFMIFQASVSLAQSSAVLVPQPKMGQPLARLTAGELARFERGKRAFKRQVAQSEGLGPAFNDSSCANCHNHPVDGGTSIGLSQSVRRFGRVTDQGHFDPLEALGGSLLQSRGIFLQAGGEFLSCHESIPLESNLQATRISTPMFGLGLVEAVPDSQLFALEHSAAQSSSSSHAISGIVHPVLPLEGPSTPRAGRFGWKSQVATSLSFAGDAALNEMGVTNRLLPHENAPNGDQGLLALCDSVADPEHLRREGSDFIDSLSDFQRFLAPPPQTPRSGMRGEAKFIEVGCTGCHTPSLRTSNDPTLEIALRDQEIKPYSDFLLHDMGSEESGGLGDGIVQGFAAANEMRTAPLWGFVGRQFLGHAGRASSGVFGGAPCFPGFECPPNQMQMVEENLARNLQTIVQQHAATGSEAAQSALRFLALPENEVRDIAKFFLSLGRAPFDALYDRRIDNFDLQAFRACWGKPSLDPNETCALFDSNQDTVLDSREAEAFIRSYEGHRGDCNCNAIPDPIDILVGTTDANRDGVPDSCAVAGGTVEASCPRPALSFSYPGEHVVVPLSDSIKLAAAGSGFSGALWVKLSEAPNGQTRTILDHPGTFSLTLLNTLPRRIALNVTTQGTRSRTVQSIYSAKDLPLNEWVHLGFVYRDDVQQRSLVLYVNGVKSAETTALLGPVVPSEASLYVGDSPRSGYLAKGAISEVAIFKRALSESELLMLRQQKPNRLDSSLAFYLDFASITGIQVTDRSMQNVQAQLVGSDISPPNTPGTFYPSARVDSLRLAWSAADDNEGGTRFYTKTYVGETLLRQGTTTSAALIISPLVQGNTYRVEVQAEDGAKNKSALGTFSMLAENVPPSLPSQPKYSRNPEGGMDLSWTPATDNVRVRGYRVLAYKGSSYLGTTYVETPQFSLSSSDPLASYRFFIYAYDQAGNQSVGGIDLRVPPA
jgi:hypothetical protein